MKKILAFAALISLLPAVSQATLYKWTGSVDYGAKPEDVSCDFEATGNQLWSMDFNVGAEHYVFQPQFYAFFDSQGKIIVEDAPLSGSNTGDLQFNEDNSSWAFNSGTDNASEFGGHISSFFRGDTAPTPEPSSFVLMGAAFIAFALFRKRLFY